MLFPATIHKAPACTKTLAAWRGATIVNAILGEERYATGDEALPIEWATGPRRASLAGMAA